MTFLWKNLGSHEQSPHLADSSFHYECHDTDVVLGPDSQLREDLADAMKDDPAISGKFDKRFSHFSSSLRNYFFALIKQIEFDLIILHFYTSAS